MKSFAPLLVATAGMLFFATSSFAAHPWGMAGCGLGSLVFNDHNPQISAATTNGTGSQSFALTSGTSHCFNPKKAAYIEEQENFFVANLTTLSKDASRGQGDTLGAMAQVFGCEDSQHVGQVVKDSYTRIFSLPGAMAIYDETLAVLKEDPQTARSCTRLI